MAVERFGSLISNRAKPLPVGRSSPWDRMFRRVLYHWRYGYGHPDEDLLPVIDAAGDSLNIQLASLTAVLRGPRLAAAEKIKGELDAELLKSVPDFSTLLAFEARISALYPPALAARRQWIVQERFARVSARSAYASWLYNRPDEEAPASSGAPDPALNDDDDDVKPPTGAGDPGAGGTGGGAPTPPAPPPPVPPPPSPPPGGPAPTPPPRSPLTPERADALTLLGYIHSNYVLSISREKAVRDLKRWLLMRFWTFLALFTLGLATAGLMLWALDRFTSVDGALRRYWPLLLGLSAIAAAGRIGATTSIVRRLQTAVQGNILAQDAILELTALRTGKHEVLLSLLSSSIFALLLYALFATAVPEKLGFASGIFPTMATSAADEEAEARDRAQLAAERAEAAEQVEEQRNYLAGLQAGGAGADTAGSTEFPVPVGANGAETNLLAAGPDDDAAGRQDATVVDPAAARLAAAQAELTKREEAVAAASRRLEALGARRGTAEACVRSGTGCDSPFPVLAAALGFAGAAEFFKMLLWAFVAGFAERFVPDMLDRLVAGTGPGSGSEAAAIAAVQARPAAPRQPPASATVTGQQLNE